MVGLNAVTAHRRQFVVGPAPFHGVPGWEHGPLENLWLSHCPTLPVAVVADADGRTWALLGRAVESRSGLPDPAEQVSATRTEQVPSLYEGWAGRWSLVGAGELHLDATGLLGCYAGLAADGAAWASSSPPLVAALVLGGVAPQPKPWPLAYEAGISWVVPPRSRFPGIRRLLPSQVLVLADGSVRPRPLVGRIETERPFEETLALLEDSLATALNRLTTLGRVSLGLTAGADSRLVLAAAHRIGAEVTAFTRLAPRASLADRILPPQLAAAVRVEHRFLEGTLPRRPRRGLVLEHTGGHVGAGDAEPFLHGDRGALTGFAVGGWNSAVGRGYRMLPRRISEPSADAARIARILAVPKSSPAHAALREWLEWVAESPQTGLDLPARFKIEQQYAGWMAAKEQLYDLDAIERVALLSSQRMFALQLSLPEEARVSRRWQYEVVNRCAPDLSAYPFNPPDRHFGVARAAERRLRHPLASAHRVGRRARNALRVLAARAQ